ncbi:glycosyltransferase family 2 protein [Heyndrickxia sp. NPDC080065]|uniref:glycosyltransferase family 2 protein n=1 Tax=Heyndrickxia sp. NPDC080065 TaxID=3390568 RepID=UPI003D07156C
MNDQKVSVIVPIYNVEKYLERCVDSIINQTYENLEIILVNDGSLDNSGRIAEEYKKIDNRVKAFHKQNGGLSDARNFGIKQITGECILFVDSDDWLEPNMIEKMVNTILEYKADVVQSAFYYAYEDHLLFDNRYFDKTCPPLVLSNKELMKELVINEKVKNFAWGKLFKSNFIQDIPFEKGVLFEDVFWAHKVMHRVHKYVILNDPLCYYFQRNDSIVATYSPRNLDIIRGLKERHCFLEEYYQDLTEESLKGILKTSLIHYNLLLANRKKDKGATYRKDIKTYIKSNYRQFKKSVKHEKTLNRQLILFSIHPYLNVLYLFVQKIVRKLKINRQPVGLQRLEFKS